MTIGIDASRANRDFKTGTEWYSYHLIKNLIKIDKQNNYILYTDKPFSKAFLDDLNSLNLQNFKIKVLNWPFSYFWTLGRLSLEMLFKSPDVLFVPAHGIPLFFPRKTINTIHDIAFIKNECLYSKEISSGDHNINKKTFNFFIKTLTFGKYCLSSIDYLNWSTKFALKRAKKIITVSNASKKDIVTNYKKIKEDKIRVVHNGFDNEKYKLIKDQEGIKIVLNKYGIDFPFFLYVGRLERKKNIYRLIEAFAIFKENNPCLEKLVLVGSAGFGYDEIKYMIEEFGIENEVIILGWVEENDLPFIFNKALCFIFPSFFEGFGIPVLQSMACGTPVIASNIDALHEVAGDCALFFNHLSSNDLSLKMKQIFNDKDLRELLIEKSLIRSKLFSWEKCAQETLKEINSL